MRNKILSFMIVTPHMNLRLIKNHLRERDAKRQKTRRKVYMEILKDPNLCNANNQRFQNHPLHQSRSARLSITRLTKNKWILLMRTQENLGFWREESKTSKEGTTSLLFIVCHRLIDRHQKSKMNLKSLLVSF